MYNKIKTISPLQRLQRLHVNSQILLLSIIKLSPKMKTISRKDVTKCFCELIRRKNIKIEGDSNSIITELITPLETGGFIELCGKSINTQKIKVNISLEDFEELVNSNIYLKNIWN